VLRDRYVLYGEWLYAKHTIFYTDLPHYLLEFDLYDTQDEVFLSTERRMQMLQGVPFVASVKVLHAGPIPSLDALQALLGPSHFIAPDHREQRRAAALARGRDPAQALGETDGSGLMEGLYISHWRKEEDPWMIRQRGSRAACCSSLPRAPT
jgi:hypothetical protein